MSNKKKRTKSPISPLVKKITMLLYIVIAILSILSHKIANLENLLLEIIVYTCLAFSLNLILENVSVKQIKKFIKVLFGRWFYE